MTLSNILAAGSIMIWATAWAATEKKTTHADGATTKMSAELSFSKGSAKISAADKLKLRGLINGAKGMREIEEVLVILKE